MIEKASAMVNAAKNIPSFCPDFILNRWVTSGHITMNQAIDTYILYKVMIG